MELYGDLFTTGSVRRVRQSNFRLLQAGLYPRKAALYLHNLTTILADKATTKKPQSLAYTITDKPDIVHDLLLQNSNGKFQLVVWGEKASGSVSVDVTFAKKVREIKVYDPVMGTSAILSVKAADKISLNLSDHPMVVEL
ncbi:hypothetical protein [Mucilaginibacter antarcticus]|uniref:hypothetical protein n=1 Tax=Mucilaginibacter antarcticus TaxID=1855725 RepID=UPI00363F6175